MMKQASALIGALVITGIVGAAIVLVGANVFFNKNNVPVTNSPSGAATTVLTSTVESTQDQPTVQQLQDLIAQYQSREQQYQAQLNQAQQEIQQASSQIQQINSQVQQYQGLIQALQQRGVITIGQDGTIYVRRGNGF
jgi:peptidoglycan hydrolase CwlO-like protein